MNYGSDFNLESSQLLPPPIKAPESYKMDRRVIFLKPFKGHILDSEEWSKDTNPYSQSGVVWYTHGSSENCL